MRSPLRWLIIETARDRRATEALMLEIKALAKTMGLDPAYINVSSRQVRRPRKSNKKTRAGPAR